MTTRRDFFKQVALGIAAIALLPGRVFGGATKPAITALSPIIEFSEPAHVHPLPWPEPFTRSVTEKEIADLLAEQWRITIDRAAHKAFIDEECQGKFTKCENVQD